MQPTLLIASPQMRNPVFARTVVLVWGVDNDGVFGVVVNRQLDQHLEDVLDVAGSLDLADHADVPVVWGGPIESGVGTVVTAATIGDEEGKALVDGVAITHSQPTLLRLLRSRGRTDPQVPLMLCLGYAGWIPGQLEGEIEQGSWLCTEVSPQLLFETPHEERYDRALATLGLTAKTVWMQPVSE